MNDTLQSQNSTVAKIRLQDYDLRSWVSKGMTVNGSLEGECGVLVAGEVLGDVRSPSYAVVITGTVDGDVEAATVIVVGKVRGSVTATVGLAIGATGSVGGRVHAPTIRQFGAVDEEVVPV